MKIYQFCGMVENIKSKDGGNSGGYCDGVLGSNADLTIPENYNKLKEDIWEVVKKEISPVQLTPHSRLVLISLSVIGEK
jgi:thiamine phosphate synthase YjbQ (UPF0047 family)